MRRLITIAAILLVASVSFGADQIKVLIVDGINNHDWANTTKANKATLEQTGRFKVDISTTPGKRASKEDWNKWHPKFSDYDVVLSNFNDDCEEENGCDTVWSEETQADFLKFVREGGGFVPVHAADNAFGNWPEYNEIIGIGGWGGRKAGKSGSLLRLIDGKWQATSPNKGRSGDDEAVKDFLVIHDKPNHPILKGLPTKWMHAEDELYASLRGPVKNVEVLAHSFCRQTNENEPMMMIITYGKGKIFHIPMGHWNDEFDPIGAALHCVGFQTALARGTEYVATGKVTIGIPDSFPTEEETSFVAPDKLKWPGSSSAKTTKESPLKMVDGKVDVFGLSVEGEGTEAEIMHGANIIAAWLDNDEDGMVDNQKVVDAIIKAGQKRVGIIGRRSWVNQRDIYMPDGKSPWPYNPETGRYDATLEELLHCVTQYGYGEAYPEVWGEREGTVISEALDIARDSTEHNDGVPKGGYGPNAWFHYDDPTCEYGGCQITEYIYWAITSLVGIQKDRCDKISHEWELCTAELVREKDAAFMALYNNPEYKLPRNMPDGTYRH